MDEEIDSLVIGVRADTAGFARDVADMKAQLTGPLADGVARAGQAIEGALARAIRTGSLGFEDLKRVAMSVLSEIARSAISAGLGAAGLGGGGGLAGIASALAGALLGAPGRAIGGPVSRGRPYVVGERGPELFVPASHGRVEPVAGGKGDRNIRITVNVHGAGATPERMAQSGRQLASAVSAALARADG